MEYQNQNQNQHPTTSEYAVDYIGVIPNQSFSSNLDVFGRTEFLRMYDNAKKSKIIRSLNGSCIDFRDFVLQVLSDKIAVLQRSKKKTMFEVSIPLIHSCGSLSEDGLILFTFNISPYQENQNYRDLLVLAIPNEEFALKLSEKLNDTFSKYAEEQVKNVSKGSRSDSTSFEPSSPLAPLDTPLTDSSHQSSVVSKAINEVLTCLRPEEVPHFREIIRRYNSGEQNVKIFAQKLVELLGPGRKKRLSYLKHVLRNDDVSQFNASIL